MTHPPTTVIGDAGVGGVVYLIGVHLGWHARPQPGADVGIDVQVETIVNGQPTGRLLGLQVKAGASWFDESTPDGTGWVFRESTQKHRWYWLGYPLPVLIVLFNTEACVAYWQVVTEQTIIATGRGFKVIVPKNQRLNAAAAPALEALARQHPEDAFRSSLPDIPASCATRLATLWSQDPARARELSTALRYGRAEPDATVARFLSQEPGALPWQAWAALGDYASEYDLDVRAAECYLRAEQAADETQPARRFATFAGLLLTAPDPARARVLLSDALAASDDNVMAAIGLAVLEHADGSGPVALPELVQQAANAADDATIQRFLGEQASRAGDFGTAVARHTRALVLAPDSPGQQLALAEALLRRTRPDHGGSGTADCLRAANLANAARALRRRWQADSVEAAVLLLHALTLAGDERSAIRVAIGVPDGDATAAEAASPVLALYAARLCYELGDLTTGDQLSEVVAAAGDPEWIRQCAAVRATACGAPDEEQIRQWRATFGADSGRNLVAFENLARLGCWPLPELDAARDRGLLTDGIYDALHAKALTAAGQADEALQLLRGIRYSNLVVAETYARTLLAVGHVDECVRVCDEAALRFGDPRFDLLALDALTSANRADEVTSRSTRLLGDRGLPYSLRHRVRGKLGDLLVSRADWLGAERQARDGLAEVSQLQQQFEEGRTDLLAMSASARAELDEHARGYQWTVILSQYNRGAVEDAIETLKALAPAPRGDIQLRAWSWLHRVHGWTPDTARQALALAEADTTPTDIAGGMLFSLLQCCRTKDSDDAGEGALPPGDRVVVVSDEFAAQLSDSWTIFVDRRQPNGVRRLSVADEDLAATLQATLTPASPQLAQVVDAVRAGTVPLGLLSAMQPQPYLLDLIRGTAGMVLAVDPILLELEVLDARMALGGSISIEGSALYVAAAVGQVWATIQRNFLAILLAAPSLHDALASHVAVRSTANVVGHLWLDPSRQLSGAPAPEAARQFQFELSNRVYAAVQQCTAAPLDSLQILGARHHISVSGAWLGPMAIAAEHGVALYCDDVALRTIARGKGIPAFGTLALLQVMLERGSLDHDQYDQVLSAMFDACVVDIPTVWPLIIHVARSRGSVTPSVLANLARPVFWQDVPRDDLGGVIAAVAEAASADLVTLDAATAAMAEGLAVALEPADVILGVLGAVAITHGCRLDHAGSRTVAEAVHLVAARYDVPLMPTLRATLVRVLTDPSDMFKWSGERAEQFADELLNGQERR